MGIPDRASLRRAAAAGSLVQPSGSVRRYARIVMGGGWPGAFLNGAISAEVSVEAEITGRGEVQEQISGDAEVQPIKP